MDAGWFEQSNHPAFVFRFTKSIKDDFYVLFAFSKKNKRGIFLLLFAEAKSNVKRLWDILGAWGTPQKVTQKPSL